MLKLNKKFYSEEAVLETKKAFNNVCSCNIKMKGDYFEVYLTPKEEQVELNFEIANYALSLMN